MVARISDDYRPQLPVVGKDIPGPAVPCHVGTARLLETVNNRTRSVGCAVSRPYSDSDESDNDVLYTDDHDRTVQQVSLRNNWLTPTAVDSCAQLDDFNWFLPADERTGDLPAPESEIEVSDSESEVEYIEPDWIPLQTEMTAHQLLCPVVAQTRPMEGCDPVLSRRLHQGRDVLTEDAAVAVDTERESAASDAVVSRETRKISEGVPTVVPKLAAVPQATSEVTQPRPPESGCTDLLPPVDDCRELLGLGTPDAVESEIHISVNPDMLLTATYMTTEVSEELMEIDTPDTVESGMEITGGSPPAVSDIIVDTDVLQTAISVMTQMSDKWMVIDSPEVMESGIEMAGGSPSAEIYISVGPDVLLTAISVTTVVSEKWMERFVMDLDVLCSDGLASGDDPAKESADVGSDVCVVADSMPTAVSVRTVATEEWMDRLSWTWWSVCLFPGRVRWPGRSGRPCLRSIPLLFLLGGGGGLPMHTPWLSLSQMQRVSVLPVAGCKFPAVFLGKVAFDVVGLGVGPPCLRVDSEETLLTVIDKRAQLAHAAPGVTPVDSSEEGAPVPELIKFSVLGESLVDSLQEPMPVAERLEYAIQATALIWEPLRQVRYVVSSDVDFDSFGMVPWDAGGMHGNDCQRRETFQTMMLQWLMRLLCRCNRLRCPLARMSGLQCFNMGHNGHGINLYGVSMTPMEN